MIDENRNQYQTESERRPLRFARPPRRPAGLATAILVAALSLAVGPACDTRDGDAALEEERTSFLVWTFLLNPALTDFATACNNAAAAGLSCATSAGGAGFYATNYLNASFAITDTSNATTICADYPTAGILLDYSQAAKVCWFNCETSYWNSGGTAGFCTGANFTSYAANAFASINSCATVCRANGTFFFY